ncbi:hypothetical protein DSO57_1037588 [Entomophthora muscae]|uniref:Uncharacterized protein n=1 Tax=Entomophthora muscae TaxID=34485 RepID=A0ACC2TXN6_9FUNG|nr:hypothetical protein DSO57_1037588 [Entomophthora muscae]
MANAIPSASEQVGGTPSGFHRQSSKVMKGNSCENYMLCRACCAKDAHQSEQCRDTNPIPEMDNDTCLKQCDESLGIACALLENNTSTANQTVSKNSANAMNQSHFPLIAITFSIFSLVQVFP